LSLTLVFPLNTRETVAIDAPASRLTSYRVGGDLRDEAESAAGRVESIMSVEGGVM
jgi:hypothetical protein